MSELSFLGNTYRYNDDQTYFNIEHERIAYERAWSLIKEDDIVLDIGAQFGTWTLPAATRKPRQVYAFEPYRPFFDKLNGNISCNEEDIRSRITSVCIGFDKEERTNVPYSEFTVSTMEGGNKDKMIDVTTLDKYVSENNIEKVNHIKIDVDGPELNILEGAKDTIKRFKPNIMIEEHNFIVPNISVSIFKFLVYELQIEYSLESIPIFSSIDRSIFPQCRHAFYWI